MRQVEGSSFFALVGMAGLCGLCEWAVALRRVVLLDFDAFHAVVYLFSRSSGRITTIRHPEVLTRVFDEIISDPDCTI